MNIYQRIEKASESGKSYMAYVAVKTGRGVKTGELTGPFYIRVRFDGKQNWHRLTDSNGKPCEAFDAAKVAAERTEKEREAVDAGVLVRKVDAPADDLAGRVDAYLVETEANKSAGTLKAYRNTMRLFVKSCSKLRVSDINREDMLKLKSDLKAEGLSGRSVYNHFLNVMTFIAWATGMTAQKATGVKVNDWPNKPERDPEEYTDEELEKLLTAADADERLLLQSLLCSGLRSESELAHMTYGDIDARFSLWSVRPRNGHALKTDEAQRQVPVPEWLTKRIMKRKAELKATANDLIFPNKNGQPNGHMLRIVKRVAKRANVAGRVDDHKFRSTAITRWLRDGKTVPDVMMWVGHVQPETLLRYAAKVKLQDAKAHREITKTFDSFNGMGD